LDSRTSFLALGDVLESMGRWRAMAWIFGKKEKLIPTARTGILLLKLGALYALEGNPEKALSLLERVRQNENEVQLFSCHLSVRLFLQLGKCSEAVLSFSRFMEVSKMASDEYKSSHGMMNPEGETQGSHLALRQIFGLIQMGRDLLETDKTGCLLGTVSTGYWDELAAWLKGQEDRISKETHDFLPCATKLQDGLDSRERIQKESSALDVLLLRGLPDALSTIGWAACCHARKETRGHAAALLTTWMMTRTMGLPLH
jgi:hypothetical protein